jgi:hypothetical protein
VGSPTNIGAISRTGTSPVAAIRQRILYEGIDTPLWLYDAAQRVSAYYELDVIGNVRRLRAGKYAGETAGRPPLPADLGGYEYLAFGKAVTGAGAPAAPRVPDVTTGSLVAFNQFLRWQARPFVDRAGGVYDFRSRWWSVETATFLEPDGYGYLQRPGTLWSWPGQNPFKWRDPTGQGPRENAIAFGAFLGADVGFTAGGGAGIAVGLSTGGLGFGATPSLAIGGSALGAVTGGYLGGAIYDATHALGAALNNILLAKDAIPPLARDDSGRIHGEIPFHVPKNWTVDDLELVAHELQESLAARRGNTERKGEHGPHRNRIREEERLLGQVLKKLEECRR